MLSSISVIASIVCLEASIDFFIIPIARLSCVFFIARDIDIAAISISIVHASFYFFYIIPYIEPLVKGFYKNVEIFAHFSKKIT